MFVISFIFRVIAIFGLSAVVTRFLVRGLLNSPPARATTRLRVRGFTLIEVLVVIAILAVLAALIFPVFVRVKKSASITQDTAQMRQTYVAIKMYESDAEEMPPNLTYLVPRYMPKEILQGAGDPRPSRSDRTYPAYSPCNKWRDQIADCPRSPYMVSYAYLPTYWRTLQEQRILFSDLKARPDVGLLAALHHADHTGETALFPSSDPSLGKRHNSGIYLRTYMDGATKAISKRVTGGSWDCSWESCFLH